MSRPTSRHRNTRSVVEASLPILRRAIEAGLMHTTMMHRSDKHVDLPDGRTVVEFINCSYLGLDLLPEVLEGAQRAVADWGIHFCCARSRFSIEPNRRLEAALSDLFRGHAITFPSVTSAHLATLPLVASGVLLENVGPAGVRLIFDKNAHASMQYLKPILSEEGHVQVIPHNDMAALRAAVLEAREQHQVAVYVADSIYSMGPVCPLDELLAMSRELSFYLYLDDAHGTSICGEHGEGFLLSKVAGPLPDNTIMTYSLSKGFGCNGGGVVLPTARQAELVRLYGVTYAFSGPLDFSVIGAALEVVKLHHDGTVRLRQERLWQNVRRFVGADGSLESPIQARILGEEQRTLDVAVDLVERGYFVSAAFFPVVARGRSQLRICLSANHTEAHITGLCQALQASGAG